MIPNVARTNVSIIRKEDEAFRIANTKLLESYPEDVVKDVIKKMRDDKKAERIDFWQAKLDLHISVIEQLIGMTYKKIMEITEAQIKKLPVNKNFDIKTSKYFTPLSRLSAGRDAPGNVTSTQQGPLVIEGYYDVLEKINMYVPEKIKTDIVFHDDEEIDEDEEEEEVNDIGEEEAAGAEDVDEYYFMESVGKLKISDKKPQQSQGGSGYNSEEGSDYEAASSKKKKISNSVFNPTPMDSSIY
jgi:hypothetical protein